MIDLSNKTALITGASRGIGAAVARKFVGYGANVVLTARSENDIQTLATEIGEQALAVNCDVSRYADVQRAFDRCAAHFGSLDILVNNAGVIDPIARIEHSDPSVWSEAVDINVKGVYYCLRAAFPLMCEHGGVIINLSSGAATNALEGWSHYCATKAAVLSLTRSVHREWAKQGIRVVGISPGTVATDMQKAIKDSNINPVSELDWSEHIPPEDVAEAIAWLTQDEARDYDGQDFSLKTDEGRLQAGLSKRK